MTARVPTGPLQRRDLLVLYAKTNGRTFEPRVGTENATFRRLIEQGYLRLVDSRCGFELIKDGLAQWTEAAHTALFPEFVGLTPSPSETP